MVDYEDERTPQDIAERRRDLKIGKAVSDAVEIKLDRVRKMDFRTSSIIHMERTLKKKSWQILQALNVQDWGHEDTISLIWAGLLHEYPDIEMDDVMAMWDSTMFDDRMKAMADVIHALAKAIGAPVDEKAYKDSMDLWEKQQAAYDIKDVKKE